MLSFLFFFFLFLYFELLAPLVVVISLVDAAKVKNVGKERRSVNSIHLGLLIVGVDGHWERMLIYLS